MGHLSNEAKDAIVLKAINRGSQSINAIAEANGVGISTLQKWLRCYREGRPLNCHPQQNTGAVSLSQAAKLNHLLASHSLDEVSLGTYCRQHGLYSHQLTKWRTQLTKEPAAKQNQSELKQLKNEVKKLQRELNRKDKALAEASALLVLKKKPT
jgi:transposase